MLKKLEESADNYAPKRDYPWPSEFKTIDHAIVLGWKKDGTVIRIHCDKKGNIITTSKTRPEEGKESNWCEEEVSLNVNVFLE